MPLDSVSGQHWFDLFDKEEFTAVAVDTTLVALSGLTIVPSTREWLLDSAWDLLAGVPPERGGVCCLGTHGGSLPILILSIFYGVR